MNQSPKSVAAFPGSIHFGIAPWRVNFATFSVLRRSPALLTKTNDSVVQLFGERFLSIDTATSKNNNSGLSALTQSNDFSFGRISTSLREC